MKRFGCNFNESIKTVQRGSNDLRLLRGLAQLSTNTQKSTFRKGGFGFFIGSPNDATIRDLLFCQEFWLKALPLYYILPMLLFETARVLFCFCSVFPYFKLWPTSSRASILHLPLINIISDGCVVWLTVCSPLSLSYLSPGVIPL